MVFTAVHWWEIGHIWLVEPDKPCLMKYNHAWSWFWEILERYENHRGIKLTVPNANNDIKWFLKGRSIHFVYLRLMNYTLETNVIFSSFTEFAKSEIIGFEFSEVKYFGAKVDEIFQNLGRSSPITNFVNPLRKCFFYHNEILKRPCKYRSRSSIRSWPIRDT